MTTNAILVLTIFLLTVLLLLWRPRGINECIPTGIGAICIYLLGIVSLADISNIAATVTGASITIISTIVMSIVLESVGFFRWTAFTLVAKSRGSGIVLFWNIILLCFFMTMFFNNDGSILITTPIILEITKALELKPHERFSYLCSGALIATASSAPIGVSNLANLIALKIVNLDLVTYAKIMFVPSMLGLIVISILLFIYFQNDIPVRLPYFPRACGVLYANSIGMRNHPFSKSNHPLKVMNWSMFRVYVCVIISVRLSFFILSNYGIPLEWAAVIGALSMILIRWYSEGKGAADIIKKTPWHILVFAFSMYVVIYGVHNVNFTAWVIGLISKPVSDNLFNAVFIMGTLLSVMSNLFNNLPSVMLGTLAITQMGLTQEYLQVAYLANIIGSDIGSLILPSGTLASLIWMFILRTNKVPVSWSKYIGVTSLIIPVGLLVSLLSLYWWVLLIS